jgi:hypothetical protein
MTRMMARLFAWALIVSILLFAITVYAQTIQCHVEPKADGNRWWWRTFEGKRCWYTGGPRMIDKSLLYWPREEPPYEPDPPEWIEDPPLINRGEFQDRWDGMLDTRFSRDPFPVERWRMW